MTKKRSPGFSGKNRGWHRQLPPWVSPTLVTPLVDAEKVQQSFKSYFMWGVTLLLDNRPFTSKMLLKQFQRQIRHRPRQNLPTGVDLKRVKGPRHRLKGPHWQWKALYIGVKEGSYQKVRGKGAHRRGRERWTCWKVTTKKDRKLRENCYLHGPHPGLCRHCPKVSFRPLSDL